MKKLVPIVILVLAVAGCKTLSMNYRQGAEAEMNQKYEEAVQYYQKAALDNPNESVYRVALVRARTSASLYFLQQARTLVAQNKR